MRLCSPGSLWTQVRCLGLKSGSGNPRRLAQAQGWGISVTVELRCCSRGLMKHKSVLYSSTAESSSIPSGPISLPPHQGALEQGRIYEINRKKTNTSRLLNITAGRWAEGDTMHIQRGVKLDLELKRLPHKLIRISPALMGILCLGHHAFATPEVGVPLGQEPKASPGHVPQGRRP